MQAADRVPTVTAATRTAAPSLDALDLALIKRIALGDQAAMQALFLRHQIRVYRFVLRIVKQSALAEELITEVFLDVWRCAGRFEARSSVATWILSIARHKALSALKRRPEVQLDLAMALAVEDPANNPEVAILKQERGAVLRECLATLSPEHQEVIDLVYYHQRSVADVAAIVGIPANTVKTRVFCARRHLAKRLTMAGVERAAV